LQLHEYETTLIIRPDLNDADTTGIMERFEASLEENEGTLLVRDDWGKRKLAYTIAKHNRGHYVLFSFLSNTGTILELERRIRIDDRVMRFLTVRVADSVDVPARMAEAAEQREKLAEIAAKRAEEAAVAAAKAAQEAAALEAAKAADATAEGDAVAAAKEALVLAAAEYVYSEGDEGDVSGLAAVGPDTAATDGNSTGTIEEGVIIVGPSETTTAAATGDAQVLLAAAKKAHADAGCDDAEKAKTKNCKVLRAAMAKAQQGVDAEDSSAAAVASTTAAVAAALAVALM
jgi:small subunit ribosomal protein S6